MALANAARLVEFDRNSPSNLVSVIVPVYNGAKYIAATLDSILGQTLPPTEVIVIDDGSTDNSAQVIAAYGNSVALVTTENRGVCSARNTGASMARGNWLAFCDADDLWLPTKLEKQLRLANEAPDVQCVLVDYAEITEGVVSKRSHLSFAPKDFWIPEQHPSGFVVREPITGKLTTFQPGITSASIVKRSLFRKFGGFDLYANQWSTEDTCFHFHCLNAVPFGVVPEELMHYRRHPAAVSYNQLKQLRNTVFVWEYIAAEYPQAQPYRDALLQGLKAMRKEVTTIARYRRRQKLKRLLGWK